MSFYTRTIRGNKLWSVLSGQHSSDLIWSKGTRAFVSTVDGGLQEAAWLTCQIVTAVHRAALSPHRKTVLGLKLRWCHNPATVTILEIATLFPCWAIPARCYGKVPITQFPPTCQELGCHDWGQVSSPDVDVRRATAWNKRCPTTKPRVKKPCYWWKKLSCCWRQATAARSLSHANTAAGSATVTLHWQTSS